MVVSLWRTARAFLFPLGDQRSFVRKLYHLWAYGRWFGYSELTDEERSRYEAEGLL